MREHFDVAIIGGGPGGSSLGALLKKYNPALRVAIFEKEKFPREHVGESQLPACGFYLDEIGCWDKMERADFPIKVGATYRWGASDQLWDFEFLPLDRFTETDRPGKYAGQRRLTAWQVDREVYDDILLKHAAEMGCQVFEETLVREVLREGDRVLGLRLGDGREIEARWYIDASGHVGVLRRAMGVECSVPTKLMNIAMWDYWTDAKWATTIGQGGTRVQVLSLGYGWIWFIPISPTRTSCGFICPAEYYKKTGKSPEELYAHAVQAEPRVRALTKDATREGQVRTTKDWSFVADRMTGENWFLVGESGGFADPILAGGLTLTHENARAAAHIILAIDAGDHPAQWLKKHYERTMRRRVLQYIRFADFWYAANGQFTDLEGITTEIAKDAGLKLNAKEAFRWLSLGGFNPEDGSRPGIGGLDLHAVKQVTGKFIGETAEWELNRYNEFRLNLNAAKEEELPAFRDGKVTKYKAYRRGDKVLNLTGPNLVVAEVLRRVHDMPSVAQGLMQASRQLQGFYAYEGMAALETMLVDGWVVGKVNPKHPIRPYLPDGPSGHSNFHDNADIIPE